VKLLSLAVFALCSVAAAAEPIPDVMTKLRAIESAQFRNKADDLRLQHSDAVKARPNELLPRVYVAWCSMPSDAAWNQLKGLTIINPNYPWARYGMARIYLGWKLKEQAESDLKLALKADPKFYPALTGLGDVARAASKFTDAEARYREALAIQDDAEAHGGLGLALLEQGKKDEAKAELQKAVALWPDQPRVLQALAAIAREQKDLQASAKSMSLLLELTPRDRVMRKQLAELKLELGDLKGAAEQYEAYLKYGDGDANVFRSMADTYRKLNDPVGEQRALEQLSGVDATSPEAPLRMSELAEAKKDLEGAEVQLLEASARAPNRADIKLKLGRLRAKRYSLKEAIEAYREAAAAPEGQSAEIEKEKTALEAEIGLTPERAKGTVEAVNAFVSKQLNKFYLVRLTEHPELEGMIKAKARISAEGQANSVEIVEDTIGDPLLAAHVYFALKDADYAKKKRDPIFEFMLKPPKRR
jgi:tetratricopeptide (TPR) repeat protein